MDFLSFCRNVNFVLLGFRFLCVKDWSRSLSNNLVEFSKTLTYYDDLSQIYQSVQSVPLHGDSLVNDIANDFEVLLKSKLKAVMDLVTEAEKVYMNYTYDEDLDVGYLNSKTVFSYEEQESTVLHFNGSTDPADETVKEMAEFNDVIELVQDKKFMKTPVNYNYSTVHVPTNVYDRSPNILNGAYWTRMLDDKFKENNERFKSLRWQYFCSSDGFFRVYPGLKWPRDNDKTGTDTYDCRVRSWYLQAATCPKHVLILLDTSGSMKGSRMVIARSTVKAILNTLDDDDYFNILRFSDTIEYVDPCFEGSMMQATEMNKRHLQELIDVNITARKGAYFKHAFDTAFNLLKFMEYKRQSRLCNKAILLITDGVPEHYDLVFKYHTKNFTDIQTRVFTFLIGREVDDDREVRWMACANKGYYSHISTLADVQENVQNYIKVMSRPMVIKRFHNKIWTSIYLDHMSHLDKNEGLQFMTSVAIPVFDTKNETFNDGNLLGVMGTDVPVASLQELVPVHKLGANGFAFLINHNGYVLMHPDYTPFRYPSAKQSVLNPYYNNIDLNDVTQTSRQFKDVRKRILTENNNFGSAVVELRRFYDNMRRMSKRNYHIFYRKVIGTDFSIGIALPATSMRKTPVAGFVPSLLDDCLNETNIEIAPWLYCSDLDPKLTGKERIRALLEIKKRNPENCKQKLLDYLTDDAQNLKNANLNQKWSQSTSFRKRCRKVNRKVVAEHFARQNITLLFIGTRNGLTRYMSVNDSFVPHFIQNNTDTLNADYYKRAVEAIEDKVDKKPRYTFTFSVDLDEEFNVNTSVVTASAPIYEKEYKLGYVPFVYAVVGLQMEYKKFEEIFMSSTQSVLSMKTPCDNDSYCSCKDQKGNCYLVDNHGYVVASKFPDYQVGLFFGDIPEENSVMNVLVDRGVFTRDEFTDYQALCERDSDDDADSSAPNLLNPIKAFLSGMLWTITEFLLFMSEFSFKSFWFSFGTSHSANALTKAECESLPYDTFGPMEKVAYSQACPSQIGEEDAKTYDPCHKTFKLYKVNYTRLPFHGEISGIFTDESRVNEGMERAPVIRSCTKPFTVTWVKDTNLLLIVTSRLCNDPSDLVDFELAHRKKNYSTQQMCQTRERREIYINYTSNCRFDRYDNETKTCGVAKQVISTKVLLISFLLSCIHIFVHCVL
ncbi:Voltage-dependent calcium channel subunit alpha-2/delta-4 [Mactra antiquata]